MKLSPAQQKAYEALQHLAERKEGEQYIVAYSGEKFYVRETKTFFTIATAKALVKKGLVVLEDDSKSYNDCYSKYDPYGRDGWHSVHYTEYKLYLA